ncbi:MAG: sulfate reduction electron transfer complex DsrMKJOP subunit DsrM [Planctomycetota bacterium]
MNALVSFLAVVALVVIALAGIGLGAGAGADVVFGVIIPYAAILLFLVGFVVKVLTWAKAPVPFRIPTVAGQAESLDFIPQQKLESPSTGGQVFVRMVLEVLFFRSLFRNTRADMKAGPRIVYGADKLLWAAAMLFHWTFLIIFLRHLRFFTEPVPFWISGIESLDAFFEVTVPALYLTNILIVVGLGWLLLRRFLEPQVRYISLASDYFPLFLLFGVVISGVFLRYLTKTDVVAIKELAMGLLSFKFAVPEGIGAQFYVHLFLVSALIAYFPFSKLMHLPGVFLSPTRNLANNNRKVRHVNPWNPEVKKHEFDHWKEEFAEEIAEAGYELEERE